MFNTFLQYSMFSLNGMLNCAVSIFNTHTQHEGRAQLVSERNVSTWPCLRSKVSVEVLYKGPG